MRDVKTIADTRRLALKLSEVAAKFGIHKRTIQRMVHKNEFPQPTCWAGKLPMWSPDIVEAWARGEWRPEAKPARSRKAAVVR